MDKELLKSSKHYLTFTLADEQFALGVSSVKEILDFINITQVPQMPDFMLGVINLRGNVVPIIDLRLKLGMPATEKTVYTCIVFAEIAINDEFLDIGMLVDSVQEVIELEENNIQDAPRIGMKIEKHFIDCLGKYRDSFLIILNPRNILREEDLDRINNQSKKVKK